MVNLSFAVKSTWAVRIGLTVSTIICHGIELNLFQGFQTSYHKSAQLHIEGSWESQYSNILNASSLIFNILYQFNRYNDTNFK